MTARSHTTVLWTKQPRAHLLPSGGPAGASSSSRDESFPDLVRVFPELDLFDRVIAENGALLFEPAAKREAPLAPEPSPRWLRRDFAQSTPCGESMRSSPLVARRPKRLPLLLMCCRSRRLICEALAAMPSIWTAVVANGGNVSAVGPQAPPLAQPELRIR